MAHNVQKVLEIPAQPWYIETNDTATRNWLNGLAAPSVKSNTSDALWAKQLATGKYIVSAEAYKRVQARRFS